MSSDKGKKIKYSGILRIVRLLPVILSLTVVPLLVRVMPYSLPLSGYDWIGTENDTVLWDVFSYVKLMAMVYIVIFAALVFVLLLIIGGIRVKRTPVYIPMVIYLIMVILSAFFSENKVIALRGGMDRFEGTIAIACYMLILFYTIQAVEDIKDVIIVLVSLGVTVLTECLIGLTQFAGADVLFSDIGRRLIAGDLQITPEFRPGQVYQTVGNMNYVPMWLCMAVPVLILLLIISVKEFYCRKMSVGKDLDGKSTLSHMSDRNVWILAFACVLLLGLAGINCLGSKAAGGLAGMTAAVTMMGIYFIPSKRLRAGAAIFMIIAAVAGVILIYNSRRDELVIDFFETSKDSLKMSLEGRELTIRMAENGEPLLYSENGEELDILEDEKSPGIYYIEGYAPYERIAYEKYLMEGEGYVMLLFPSDSLLFHFGQEVVTCCNSYGHEVPLSKVARFGFYGHYGFASGRGYIWADSLPLIGRSLGIGSGADTFMLQYPQTDYAAKITSGGVASTIVDKAHSLYLQMLLTTGGVSLLAFLSIICIAIGQAYKFCRKDKKSEGNSRMTIEELLVTGMMFGMIGFLIAGLSNDSTVSIMPIFYTILGTILAATGHSGDGSF